MHSFLIDMCRSCLTTNVNLKKYFVVEDKEVKCFDAVKVLFPNTVIPVYFGYEYSLCEICINLLKSAVIFQKRLTQSHNAYTKYMKTLNFSNHFKFSIMIVQHINKGHIPMLKTGKGSLKQTENTCNQIPANDTYFQDILIDEVINCNSSNDNDNCNQMDSNLTENTLFVKNMKQEHENLNNEYINRIERDILVSDNDSCYLLDSKIDVEEHKIPWESTKKDHENFESVCGRNRNLANKVLCIDFKQEKTTAINSEEKTSQIILTINKVSHKRKRPYKCHVCKASFFHNSNLIKHKCVHTEKASYTCNVCRKNFGQKSSFIKHKYIHARERSHKCDICEKSFPYNSVLITHKRVHTGERPYKCDICEKSFSQSGHLTIHKRSHTQERLYKCDVCERSFSLNAGFIRHKIVHTGERPFKCDVCEKSFSQNSNLKTHKRCHTGERPYKCDICEKSFPYNSVLITHKRVHTGERPYKCDICEKSFSQSCHLTIHKRSHTPRTAL